MSLYSRSFFRPRSIANRKLYSLPKNTAYRYLHISTAKMTVQRITMFKVASEGDIPKFLEQYQTLAQNQKKVHCVNCQAQIANSMADRFPYQTGRQAIHPLSRCPPPSKRSSYPRLQRPCTHNLLFSRRCEILRRKVRGTCGAQGVREREGCWAAYGCDVGDLMRSPNEARVKKLESRGHWCAITRDSVVMNKTYNTLLSSPDVITFDIALSAYFHVVVEHVIR
jgi:hypothetical protein